MLYQIVIIREDGTKTLLETKLNADDALYWVDRISKMNGVLEAQVVAVV